MNTVLSYCLFEPLHMHPHRTWDANRFEEERYWYNIPSLVIANSILYPKFKNRFYLSDGMQNHPVFPLLQYITDVHLIKKSYTNTSEPMLWRMMPLWDPTVDCFFTRDVDSVPNRQEAQSTLYFHESNFFIQTIRSHENHYHEQGCDMLGGLSGFKPKHIPNLPTSFDEYYTRRMNIPWAQDQYLMVETFINSVGTEFTGEYFLDCPIDKQNRSAVFNCVEVDKKHLNNIKFNDEQNKLLDIIEKYSISTWAGEPCDARGDILREFMDLDNTMSRKIKKYFSDNEDIANFYKV